MTAPIVERLLPDEAAMMLFAEDLAAALRPGDVVALSGDLGAGKTTLARAAIRWLADDTELEVPSPTFTLVQDYRARIPVRHFDLYRLGGPEELRELGLEDDREAIVLVEWPERAGPELGATLWVRIEHEGNGRRVAASGEAAARLERSLAIRQFLGASGRPRARRRFLLGDASTRTYETVEQPDEPIRIMMNAPPRPDGPPVRDGLPYSRIAHLAETVVPFVAVDLMLRDAGFAAPEILARSLEEGLLLIEHLGVGRITDDEGGPVRERYLAAARLLAAMHDRDWPRERIVDAGHAHRLPDYDRRAMGIETELVTDWYLPHMADVPSDDAMRASYTAIWSALFDRLDVAEKCIVLRDYHSPNVIWRDGHAGHDRIGLIDFQDAVWGPAAYDVASLAQDARVTISPALESEIVEAYAGARRGDFDRSRFDEAYAIMAAQRNSKILGIFVRLDRRDGKPGYLRHLPRIRDYLERSTRHPALAALRTFYREAGVIAPPDAR